MRRVLRLRTRCWESSNSQFGARNQAAVRPSCKCHPNLNGGLVIIFQLGNVLVGCDWIG